MGIDKLPHTASDDTQPAKAPQRRAAARVGTHKCESGGGSPILFGSGVKARGARNAPHGRSNVLPFRPRLQHRSTDSRPGENEPRNLRQSRPQPVELVAIGFAWIMVEYAALISNDEAVSIISGIIAVAAFILADRAYTRENRDRPTR